MPPDRLDEAVDVLQELPGEAGLADPGRADDAHEARPLLAAGRMEEVLEQPELVVAADERGLERLAPVPAADLGHDSQGAPGGDGGRLALERLLAGLLEGDRPRRGPLGRLADEDGAGLGDRLERAAVLTRSPATMPWFVAPIVTAASPVRTPARAWIVGPSARTASTSSRPARTARSASSSCAVGAPQTAMTASPMNFSTVPP